MFAGVFFPEGNVSFSSHFLGYFPKICITKEASTGREERKRQLKSVSAVQIYEENSWVQDYARDGGLGSGMRQRVYLQLPFVASIIQRT